MKLFLILSFLISSVSFALPIDSGSGKVEFLAVGKPSAIKIRGEGKGPQGELHLKKSGTNVTLSGDLSVDLDSIETGIGLRDRHMKEKYLETGKFKTASLKIKEAALPITALSGTGDYTVPGLLTLKGVEKPVQLNIKLEPNGDKVKSVSSFKINLSDFPIEVPKYAGITVANDVDVSVESLISKTDLATIK